MEDWKHQHQNDDTGEQDPVDLADIDLARFLFRGVGDFHAWQQAQRHGLLGDGEGTGDHGLGGNDGDSVARMTSGMRPQDGAMRKSGFFDGVRV